MEFHRRNHFVPQSYLKKWSLDGKQVWGYRLLVSNDNVPIWSLNSIRGLAFHTNLYTNISYIGDESDEIERWLDKEFEAPAEEAINKVITNSRLTSGDWEKLILYTAAQCVRTPAHLIKSLERWKKEIPEILDTTLKNVIEKLEKSKTNELIKQTINKDNEFIPIKVSIQPSDESDKSLLQVETLVGRGMWLYEIKRILTNTAKILLTHKWSIFHPTGLEWITSDDPVICLNYYGNDSYDFDGGWGKTGSEVLFPLSPNHMLYTQVGKKAPPRIDLSPEMSTKLQRIVAEHGYRWIFSNKKIVDIESLRVRKVDEFAYNSEKDTWPRWGIEQKEAELNLRRKTES